MFNSSIEIECSEYVYASDEKNIQTEVIFAKSFIFQSKMIKIVRKFLQN